MDVHEIDGASNRGIDEIRELRENVKFSPSSSRYKIYIIDEVHMLTKEAFNALLKTLEEPPPHVIFVFATTETHKIPATILSRCQRYEFKRISLKEITATLRKIASGECIQVSDQALTWIAQGGEGSLRDSQSILDQAISFAGTDIADADVEALLGRGDRKYLFDLSRAILDRNAGACLKIIDEAFYAGADLKVFYERMLAHFRNLLLVKGTFWICRITRWPSSRGRPHRSHGKRCSACSTCSWPERRRCARASTPGSSWSLRLSKWHGRSP